MNKRQVSVISLDYDGCGVFLFDENFSCIINKIVLPFLRGQLTDGDMSSVLKHQMAELTKDRDMRQRLIHLAIANIINIKQALTAKILAKSEGEHRILIVGSNRQDHATDIYNSYRYGSIRCFDAYRKLAFRHEFEFCELLIADRFDRQGNPLDEKKPVGSTMNGAKPDYSLEDSPKELAQKLRGFHVSFCHRDKTELLQMQLDYFAERYPEEEIDLQFTFFDDIPEIIELNRQKLGSGELRHAKHIKAELIHFNAVLELIKRMKIEIPRLYAELGVNVSAANALGEKRKEIPEVANLSVFKEAKMLLDEHSAQHPSAQP